MFTECLFFLALWLQKPETPEEQLPPVSTLAEIYSLLRDCFYNNNADNKHTHAGTTE
jgi:hypothetical protein